MSAAIPDARDLIVGQTVPLLLGRFARLPRVSGETWQGGLVRLPLWVEQGPGGKPYRPWGAMWLSTRTGVVHMKTEPTPGAHDWALAFEALLEFGTRPKLAGCRPSRVEVADAALAESLKAALPDPDLAIHVRADLPALDPVLAALAEEARGGPLPPGMLEGAGVTVDRVRAFASAACRFYAAAPWRHLSGEDLIRVESPPSPPGLRLCSVLGSARRVYGLGFFDSEGDFEHSLRVAHPSDFAEQHGVWSLTFDPIEEIPFADAELWEQHALPVAGERLCPMAIRFEPDGSYRRPDAAALLHLESILLALAASSESEMDQGRWSREVQTSQEPLTVTLALPALLEPLDAPSRARPLLDRRAGERVTLEIHRFAERSSFDSVDAMNAALQERFTGPLDRVESTAVTPLEKAQDLAYRAFDALGRRRIQLARAALDLAPDCADAYVILAEEAGDPERALSLYEQGVAAGARALGSEAFERHAGHFWGAIPTRPYMRARLGLAQTLEALGQPEGAIEHYREMLRLNPNDNQGARYCLLPAFLVAGREVDAAGLLESYAEDPSAIWLYGWALSAFRREGDSGGARNRLRQALRANRHGVDYIVDPDALPEELPDSYALGSREEAVECAEALGEAWRATPGAQAWLRSVSPRRSSRKRRRPR